MKLTNDQAKSVINYISKVTGGKPIVCPICGSASWNVNQVVTEMREFQNGDFIIGGESAIMPFVSLTCNKCFHTLFLNAISIGVVSPQVESTK